MDHPCRGPTQPRPAAHGRMLVAGAGSRPCDRAGVDGTPQSRPRTCTCTTSEPPLIGVGFWRGPGSTRPNQQLVTQDIAQDQQWADLLAKRIPNVIKDSFLPNLVQRLENLDRAGLDATRLVRSAAAKGPLPDDHPADALWWRILDALRTRLPDRPDHQPPPEMPPPSATRLRQQPHRAPQTPGSTRGPGR